MKSLKEMKYLLLDLDGVCYGSHNGYPLEKVFGLVSKRMTLFIQEKLGLDEKKAKELQTNYFYKYNTSLNGLMLHHNVCLLYTSPSPRDATLSRMPSSA